MVMPVVHFTALCRQNRRTSRFLRRGKTRERNGKPVARVVHVVFPYNEGLPVATCQMLQLLASSDVIEAMYIPI